MPTQRRIIDDFARVEVRTRAEWRRWLGQHHASSPGVWCVTFKKGSGVPSPGYAAIVEEALCVGWVDSLPRALDAERTMLLVTPRKPKSVWSAPNRERVGRLIAAGFMRPTGLEAVAIAKANGSWEALMAAESLVMPPELVRAFRGKRTARANWDAFSAASRRSILQWLLSAKTDATRAKRLAEIVEKAAVGKRANFPVDR